MNAAGIARVRACFENAVEVFPLVVSESCCASSQGSSREFSPQMPQLPQPETFARREMTDQEDAFEERAAIVEYDGGCPRLLAEFFAGRGNC
jgi:hypothetical protein